MTAQEKAPQVAHATCHVVRPESCDDASLPVDSMACSHVHLAIPNFGVQEQPQRPGAALTDVVLNQPV